MMPPKDRNQMLLDARLQQQEEENETVDIGFNAEVNDLTDTNNGSNIDENTLTLDIVPQSHDNYQFIDESLNDDCRVDFQNGIQSRHKMIHYTPDIAFQVHLMSVIRNFCGVPLKMFEKIMDIIFVHCVQRNFDFNN
jgi:hypothetical protein